MAVAIKTNVNKLIESLKNDSENDQYIGNVEYLKFKNNQYAFSVNTFQLFFQKRNYFKFENEVRILTDLKWKSPNEIFSFPKGIKINIDPKILIEEIKLAPLADENFKILIEEKLKIQNIDVPVTYSLI